ncbi:MAG: BatD family protein [Thermomonas sp.]|uniref:BatD family protein n=1 Tax=Thermomonas sp. TaxID=1971895 RepID=UPI001B723FA9|nr:BatD family protein [Thermomonas sp.]MBP8647764.1 BatD family protein [Thermomonas sp.]
MNRARAFGLLVALCALPGLVTGVSAQTRAWLDRAQVTYGETVTLNIETSASVRQVDYRPLAAQFDIAGQTVRRSFGMVNGQSRAKSLFAVGIRPRGPGLITVPALRVGNASTSPLRLTVLPPTVQQAGGDAEAFVETEFDATQPYVQQAVGMAVRLHVAVPVLSGQLDQDQVEGASLEQVGADIQYQREIGGRRYSVVERRYLLVPERSGPLRVPGARFNGQAVGGFFDNIFDDGREPLAAAAPDQRLQVRPVPADAPQPWLPLRDLRLRYLQSPRDARVGEATMVELEAIADGARASQVPVPGLAETDQAQVFADPVQADEQFIEGRPRTTLRRRIAIVPLKPGALSLPGPRIEWWDAVQGVARTAMLPPLQLQVSPALDAPVGSGEVPRAPATAGETPDPRASAVAPVRDRRGWLLLAAVALAVIAAFTWWWSRARRASVRMAEVPGASPQPAAARSPSLAEALRQGELSAIARALSGEAGVRGDDLDGVRARLDDTAQREAIERLQAARWGDGDAAVALVALRGAFAQGPRWRMRGRAPSSLLPPLYPR